jgi:hypothetical protein
MHGQSFRKNIISNLQKGYQSLDRNKNRGIHWKTNIISHGFILGVLKIDKR